MFFEVFAHSKEIKKLKGFLGLLVHRHFSAVFFNVSEIELACASAFDLIEVRGRKNRA